MGIKVAVRRRVPDMLLWGILAVLIANPGWRAYKAPLKVQAAAPVYTVIRTERVFDKAGNLRTTNEYVDAFRGDGSAMMRVSTPIERRRRIAFANGDGVVINELTGKKSTYPKEFQELRVKRDPDKSCASEFDAKVGMAIEGTDWVGGYRAVRFTQTNGHGVWKSWYVPDVGCALVQMRWEHDEGVTGQQLASLTLGEPDASLFEVPASLVETPPSGLYPPTCLNGKCDAVPDSVKARLDKRYYETRSQVP